MSSRDASFDNDYPPGDGEVTWQHALDYVAKLNAESYLGYSDWRLPNKKELRSLVDYSNYEPALPTGHPFINVQSNYYWSSSSSTFAFSTAFAWMVDMFNGSMSNVGKDGGVYVWPVRGGQ